MWDTKFLYIDVVEVGRYLTVVYAQYFSDKSKAGRKANRTLRLEMIFSWDLLCKNQMRLGELTQNHCLPIYYAPFFCAYKTPKRKVLTNVYEHYSFL